VESKGAVVGWFGFRISSSNLWQCNQKTTHTLAQRSQKGGSAKDIRGMTAAALPSPKVLYEIPYHGNGYIKQLLITSFGTFYVLKLIN